MKVKRKKKIVFYIIYAKTEFEEIVYDRDVHVVYHKHLLFIFIICCMAMHKKSKYFFFNSLDWGKLAITLVPYCIPS